MTNIQDLNNINLAAGGFLLNDPHLYDSNVPPQLVSSLPNVQAAINGQFNTRVRMRSPRRHNTVRRAGLS